MIKENSIELLFFRYRPLYPELQHNFDTENVFDKNYMKVNMTSLFGAELCTAFLYCTLVSTHCFRKLFQRHDNIFNRTNWVIKQISLKIKLT